MDALNPWAGQVLTEIIGMHQDGAGLPWSDYLSATASLGREPGLISACTW